jgi:hypothetical protein
MLTTRTRWSCWLRLACCLAYRSLASLRWRSFFPATLPPSFLLVAPEFLSAKLRESYLGLAENGAAVIGSSRARRAR